MENKNTDHPPMNKQLSPMEQLINKVNDCSTISRQAKKTVTGFATELLTSSSTVTTEEELSRIFKRDSDCYADTWSQDGLGAPMVEGEVIQAMTEKQFIETVKSLRPVSLSEIIREVAGKCVDFGFRQNAKYGYISPTEEQEFINSLTNTGNNEQ